MATWSPAELDAIGNAEELHIQSRPIQTARCAIRSSSGWSASMTGSMYAPSAAPPVPGSKVPKHNTRAIFPPVVSIGMSPFTAVDPSLHAAIDHVYRTKYANQPAEYVDPCVTPQAQQATLELIPG